VVVVIVGKYMEDERAGGGGLKPFIEEGDPVPS